RAGPPCGCPDPSRHVRSDGRWCGPRARPARGARPGTYVVLALLVVLLRARIISLASGTPRNRGQLRAPVFHPLQYRQLPFIDLPFQWPAFNLRLTYDGGMLSVSFLSDGWFEQVARTSGSDVDRVYVRAVGVITVAVGSASLTCWRVGHGGGERNKSGWVPAS